MTRTPDEIKKGLECCVDGNIVCAGNCVFDDDVKLGYPDCVKLLMTNALALIQQLERDKTWAGETSDMLMEENKRLEERAHQLDLLNLGLLVEKAQLEAERDAALADFKLYRERNIKGECGVYACDLCKIGGKYEEWEELKCPKGCMGIEHWQWRGVQKEG